MSYIVQDMYASVYGKRDAQASFKPKYHAHGAYGTSAFVPRLHQNSTIHFSSSSNLYFSLHRPIYNNMAYT